MTIDGVEESPLALFVTSILEICPLPPTLPFDDAASGRHRTGRVSEVIVDVRAARVFGRYRERCARGRGVARADGRGILRSGRGRRRRGEAERDVRGRARSEGVVDGAGDRRYA